MRILIGFVALLVAIAFSPASSAQPAKKAARTTYDEHILPILKDRCVNCHSQDKKRGGLILNNYLKVMEGGSSGVCVKPGDADNSLLYKTTAHLVEPFMPEKQPKIAQKEIDLIKKWISEGAPENSGSKVVVSAKPKVDFSLSSVAKGKPAGPPPMPPATMSKEFVVKAMQETAVTALASSPWAPLVAVGGQKQVLLYNTDTLQLLGVIPFPEGMPNVLKFSRNGSLLVIGGGHAGKSGRVVIWSVTKAERLFAVGEETDSVCAADISPDQTRIALGGPNRVVRIFSTKTGKIENEIRKHTEWVTSLEFSPDGVLLATGDRNGGLFVWEAFTAREFFTLKGHTAAITEISWRADSNIVASSSEDTTVRLFEMENGNQVKGWGANGGGSLSVNFSKDGKLVTAGRDKLARLWDGNGVNTRNFEPFTDVALKAAFTHDGARVIAADWAGQIVVWNTADAKRIGTLSAVPPNFPALLAAAQKTLAEKQKAYDAVAASAKASEALFAKTNADVAAAQKAILDTAAASKAAEVKLAQTRAAVLAAQQAVKNTQAEVTAKDTLSKAFTEAATKVKAEADKAKDNAPLQAAATRALTLAGQTTAEMALARKALADSEAASRVVEPTLAPVQTAFNAAQVAAAEAPKKLPPMLVAQKAAQAKAAADKPVADKAMAELTPARNEVARIQAMMAVAQKK
jgi:Planctomycete cytochrome C/WD domain, G-beta repeat